MTIPDSAPESEDDEEGDLFCSDASDEETKSQASMQRIASEFCNSKSHLSLDAAISDLDGAASDDAVCSKHRLGSCVASAWFLQPKANLSQKEDDVRWSLQLLLSSQRLLEIGLTPNQLCAHNIAAQVDTCEVMLASEGDPALLISASGLDTQQEDVSFNLLRMLVHLVDLPLRIDTPDEGIQGNKRPRLSDACAPNLKQLAAQATTDMEALLDDLCMERASLPTKGRSDQILFRDSALRRLATKRTSVLNLIEDLQAHCANVRTISCKERWLKNIECEIPKRDEDLLPWALKISSLWSELPEAKRLEWQSAAHEDPRVLEYKMQVVDLKELLEELELFADNLAACCLCNVWDPWVELRKIDSRTLRVCRTCVVANHPTRPNSSKEQG